MGIDLRWDNEEQSVLLCQVGKSWTWEEMDAVMLKVKNITDHAAREIAAIIDLSAGVTIPGSLFSPTVINQAKKMLKMGETGARGPVVVIGANSLIKAAYSAFRGMDRNGLDNVSFASTLEEARTALKARNYVYA